MKSFKTILLTLLLSIGFILPSCKKDAIISPCGDTDSVRFFDIKGLDAFWYKKDGEIKNYAPITPTDSTALSDLGGLFITYEADYHASTSFSLINQTLACSIIPGFDGSKREKLTNLSIITLNDFDENHLANSSLNDVIDYQGDLFNVDESLPLTNYLDNQTETIKSQYLLLQLTKAPTLNTEVRIQIIVELSTGEIYEREIDPILVTD